jgi:hypothetical protein
VSSNGPQDARPGDPIVAPAQARGMPSGQNIAGNLDAGDILASVGEALYHWDIASDALIWSANVLDVLRVKDLAAISTGRRYAQLLDAANVQARFDAVMQTDQRDEAAASSFRPSIASAPMPAWAQSFGSRTAGAGSPAPTAGRRAHTGPCASSPSATRRKAD